MGTHLSSKQLFEWVIFDLYSHREPQIQNLSKVFNLIFLFVYEIHKEKIWTSEVHCVNSINTQFSGKKYADMP